jgi:hypothetical protein
MGLPTRRLAQGDDWKTIANPPFSPRLRRSPSGTRGEKGQPTVNRSYKHHWDTSGLTRFPVCRSVATECQKGLFFSKRGPSCVTRSASHEANLGILPPSADHEARDLSSSAGDTVPGVLERQRHGGTQMRYTRAVEWALCHIEEGQGDSIQHVPHSLLAALANSPPLMRSSDSIRRRIPGTRLGI